MNTKKLLLTAVLSIAALFATCIVASASSAVVDSGGYSHASKFGNTLVIDGIDVSEYQQQIDWAKVKRQGIDYAYIRVGFSYLASPHRTNTDSYFEYNYKEARANDIMVGVYYYSTATSPTEAQKEAKYVLDVLDGRELDLPVAYDFEMPSGSRLTSAYNSWSSSTRKDKAATNSLAFLNYIKKNSDYESMFYSYRAITSPYGSPSSNKINMNLIDNKFKVWLAQYSTDNSYERPYEYWQYTSSGSITGISGRVDCNFWYYDNNAEETKSGTKSIKNASVSLGKTSYEYTKYRKYPSVSVTYNGTKLTKGVDYKVNYIKNVLAGTAYARIEGIGKYSNVKMVPFTITTTDIADGGTVGSIADVTYSGSAKKPTVKVQYKGTTLKTCDYSVSYSNNKNAGTATAKITGKRNYHGTLTKTFKIKKATPKFTGYTTYNRTTDRDDFTINTKCDSDGKLTYKSSDTSIATVSNTGKVSLKGGTGTAVITVTCAETNNYKKATRQVNIKVTAASSEVENTTIKVSSTLEDGFIRLNWTKSTGCNIDYYEVYRSTTANSYDSTPFYTTSSGTITTYKNTKDLKDGTRYYYRIRGVRTIDGKKYYTQWSNQANRIYKAPVDPNTKLITGVNATTITAKSDRGKGFIRISWTKSFGYKVDYFEVYRATKSNTYSNTPFFKTANGSIRTYKNTKSLQKGTRYYYRIRGVRTIDGKKYYTQWSNQANRIYK
ncbi:hypothetical protein D1155_01385 [Anaerotruncus sp. 80]|uniref:Fibronectin type-III domain-containing protein n=1 Tax=Anaerotruncus colihominis TaxID=169435 RepID=A0A845QI17_9FIRM|nr:MULTISPECIES: GH25 family lysozyme [Anaerotruncus]NBH60327.1 hypothetical protein [Anaerotruncus colihominis]NCF00981.1 hypothetical protein [Anaerotruncus sp. 80]